MKGVRTKGESFAGRSRLRVSNVCSLETFADLGFVWQIMI